MQRNIIVTEDGSHSVEIPEWHVSYHSVHGAVQESLHVFIEAGLQYWLQRNTTAGECIIFEMGFGTGLNALLTIITAAQEKQKILYETVEAFPLEEEIINRLNYCHVLQRPDLNNRFRLLHQCPWNMAVPVTSFFTFKKINSSLINFSASRSPLAQPVNIIYYDAFAPRAQPELWTEPVFRQLFAMLAPGGILVTYCSKGAVRRALQAAGFVVEKLSGPPGKREMIRAGKPVQLWNV